MQARFIHDGKSIDFFPATDVPAGSVIVRGSLVGVTKLDVKEGRLGALAVEGVFDIVKGSVAVPLGSKVYWDAATNQAVLTATDNAMLGVAIEEATANDTSVRVLLG